jgi:hypothetical protein
VVKYPYALVTGVMTVEKELALPRWHNRWDQGTEGSCVGFGESMMQSIARGPKFAARWLWQRAKHTGGDFTDNPNEGTTLHLGCRVLRDDGHIRVVLGRGFGPNLKWGIKQYRWASTVDEMRGAIKLGLPLAIGVNWYSTFDHPQDGWAAAQNQQNLGYIRGGHCVCVYGASDAEQAFYFKNSWGSSYPLAKMPYSIMQRLLREDGEACLVTERSVV